LNADFSTRAVNVGFSGGEKKRAEIAQLLILNPTYAILDEIDSGLDVDGLQAVADGINRFKTSSTKGLLIITHYQKLLDYVTPDHVHIMKDGIITRSGDKNLAKIIERNGFKPKNA
jgi:Fe-S cluster assembly ATP-binding protein